MSDIDKTIKIDAPFGRVWTALTNADVMSDWMNDDTVKIELRVGGRYTIFSGETSGTFTVIEKPGFLEYTWRQREWRATWADSIVRWELYPSGKGTQVHLTHSRFPNDEERVSHDEGWDMYWLEPMKDWLESEDV